MFALIFGWLMSCNVNLLVLVLLAFVRMVTNLALDYFPREL